MLNLAMIALLSGHPSFSNASRPVRGITNPILAMEMVRNPGEVDAVLSDAPSPDREVMRIKQYADFGFIGAYAALFVLMALLLAVEGRIAAISAAALGVMAAMFDTLENLAILRLIDVDLSHTTQAMIDAIRYASLVKWALASASMALLAFLLWRTGRIGLRIVGVLDAFTALLGLYGLYNNVSLQRLGIPMLGQLIGLAILYFRPYWRNRGQSA